MTSFTTDAWEKVLADVFVKASSDYQYRELCLKDPCAAVAVVSDIELPEYFRFDFIEQPEDACHSVLLPPFLDDRSCDEKVAKLMQSIASYTHPTLTR